MLGGTWIEIRVGCEHFKSGVMSVGEREHRCGLNYFSRMSERSVRVLYKGYLDWYLYR